MFLEQPGNVYDKKAYEDIMVGDMKGFIVFPLCDERSVYGRCGGGKRGKSLAVRRPRQEIYENFWIPIKAFRATKYYF